MIGCKGLTELNLSSSEILEEFFETPTNPHRSCHRFKHRQQLRRLARPKFEISVRIVELWTKLPLELVDAASTEIFNLRLDGN